MTVYLVGAGPGDPGLLTVRGAEVLRRADVVVYDRLSVEALLDLAPPGAERISVGKAPGRVTMAQERHQRAAGRQGAGARHRRAPQGRRPVRVRPRRRGGRRAGRRRAALRGRPRHHLGHRGARLRRDPGHAAALAPRRSPWSPATRTRTRARTARSTGRRSPRSGGTIVILMGVARIGRIAEELHRRRAARPDTPAAAVHWGTRPEQRPCGPRWPRSATEPLATPSVIVVGEVAAVDLPWFERRPLFGRAVVVTRTRRRPRS